MDLHLKCGCKVTYNGQLFRIVASINFEQIRIEDLSTHEQTIVSISDLEPPIDSLKNNMPHHTTDIMLIKKKDWQEAKRREALLKPLVVQSKYKLAAIKTVAYQLGLTWRHVYNLLKRYCDCGQRLQALIPQKPMGGKDKSRIPFATEQLIDDIIRMKISAQLLLKPSLIVEEINRTCKNSGLHSPSERTIRRRIDDLSNQSMTTEKSARHSSKKHTPVLGRFPESHVPHEVWQIDHTQVDLMVVDDVFRKPIGRPYLTLAIDIYSRCIPGFCLTLDSPSSVSVGLCLTHSVFDKGGWLKERNLKTNWPIWGKPSCIYVDNACEFHGEALKRGCEAHGISIVYRPLGQTHYGGIIERVIGTFMQLVHSLPGTTFSNTIEKGNYPSASKAILTLSEFEYWLTIAITDYYHQKLHRGINQSPINRYQAAILGTSNQKGVGYPPRIYNRQAFLIDFLPIEWRTLQRHGFMMDHIIYNSPVLSSLIGNRNKYERFLIRRDPRDLSRIYVLEPHSQRYLEIPYRTLSRPTITLWEHKRAVKWLHEKGMYHLNETLIFQAIEKMREIVKKASRQTLAARRQEAKTKNHLYNKRIQFNKAKCTYKTGRSQQLKRGEDSLIKPFEDIEIW